MKLTLHIGDRNLSSWSLRGWLVLKWSGLEFDEHLISLDQPGYGEGEIEAIRAVSPSGRVPALEVDGLVVWDSLAIAETVAELAPRARLWPVSAALRAQARSVSCEMHSGFQSVRTHMSMNIRHRCAPSEWNRETRSELHRLAELFTGLRTAHAGGGPYLFGERCIADAFFTPVATRLRTYGVALGGVADEYAATLLSQPDFLAWENAA